VGGGYEDLAHLRNAAMPQTAEISAWIAFFLGLYSLAAGAGEMRSPGGWNAMLAEFERSPGLRYLAGFACLAVGAAIYLASPWREGDWLAIVANILGGLAVAEGMALLAAGDRFLNLSRRLSGNASTAWAGASIAFGLVAIVAAFSRIG
jgi:hypothetical protein